MGQWRRQDLVTGGSEVWVYRGSRVRSPPVPVVLSVYQRDSLLDGLAMYLSCDTKKFHDNESRHILHNFWTSTHRGKLPPWRRHCHGSSFLTRKHLTRLECVISYIVITVQNGTYTVEQNADNSRNVWVDRAGFWKRVLPIFLSRLWCKGRRATQLNSTSQSCPWVGFTHGLGRDFSVLGGLG